MATQNPLYTPKSVPHIITVDGKEAIIWGDPVSIASVFKGMPTYQAPPGRLISVSITARRCKRYPGDPGYTIPATTAKRYNKVNAKRNAALPGRAFTGAKASAPGGVPGPSDRIYNFRIQGAWATLVTWFEANHVGPYVLWSPSGHPNTFTDAAPSAMAAYGDEGAA